MQVKDFYFDLPESLIAKYPTQSRSDCRLLVLNSQSGETSHRKFMDILDYIRPEDLLVFNNTRVIPARMYGYKATGGKIEMLVERVLDNHRVLAHVKSSKSPKPGNQLYFVKDNSAELEAVLSNEQANSDLVNEKSLFRAEMVARHDTLFEIKFSGEHTIFEIMNLIGHMPLPPYIDRPDEKTDQERYQTVYAKTLGAVAAPTAGLHFDESLLEKLKSKGVNFAFVTLHVGAGTFQPVRVDSIQEHIMHSEYAEVTQEVVDAIEACKQRGGKVIAVGTTSVRSLESAAQASADRLLPFANETSIFIYPGYQFKIVDAIITNFHLPESTLIMLVSAFAGFENTMKAYQEAIEQQYQFFSYGDAMFLHR